MEFKTPSVLHPRQKDQIDDLFNKVSWGLETKNDTCWRIKWYGRFITLYSGKSSWKSESNARSAFTFHLKRCAFDYHEWEKIVQDNPNIPHCPWKCNMERFVQYIMESGKVEFVSSWR